MFLRLGFPAYAIGLFALVFCVNAPAPLFSLFRKEMGLEPYDLALLYSVYSTVIIITLPISGRLSDRFGRRMSVVLGLGLAAVGCMIIADAETLAGLLTGRVTQALAVAAMSASAAAALAELSPPSSAAGALGATLAMAGGGSLGPLAAGLIAQAVQAQRVVPMLVAALLAMAAAVLVLVVPAPRRVPPAGQANGAAGKVRYSVDFLAACAAVVIAFGVQSTFFTMSGPRFGEMLGAHPLVSAGVSMGIFMLTSGAGMIMGRGMLPATAMSVGVLLLPFGISWFFLLIDGAGFAFVAVSVLIAGAGHGFAYIGALRRINDLAPPGFRGRYTSTFYIAIYIGGGVPVLLMGLLAGVTGLAMSSYIFCTVVATVSALLFLFLQFGSTHAGKRSPAIAPTPAFPREEGGSSRLRHP